MIGKVLPDWLRITVPCPQYACSWLNLAYLKEAGIKFIVEPHLRFKGQPGEQWTMFFKDPSGNNLEFKAMTTIENLFAKYNVVD